MNPATVQDANGHAVAGTFDFVENGSNGSSTDVTGTVLDAGHYNLSVTFIPNDKADYNNSNTESAEVDVATLYIKVAANNATKVYGQTNDQALSTQPEQVWNSDYTSYTTVTSLNSHIFTGDVQTDGTIQWDDAFQGTFASSVTNLTSDGVYDITPVGSYAIDPNYLYGEGGGSTKVTAHFLNSDGLDYGDNTYSGLADIDVTYVQGTLTISPQSLSIGAVYENLTYGTTLGSAMNPATVQDANGHAVAGTFDFVENGSNGSSTDVTGTVLDAGHYNLSVTFIPNDKADYNNSNTESAEVDVATLYIKVAANNATKVYGQTNDQACPLSRNRCGTRTIPATPQSPA